MTALMNRPTEVLLSAVGGEGPSWIALLPVQPAPATSPPCSPDWASLRLAARRDNRVDLTTLLGPTYTCPSPAQLDHWVRHAQLAGSPIEGLLLTCAARACAILGYWADVALTLEDADANGNDGGEGVGERKRWVKANEGGQD